MGVVLPVGHLDAQRGPDGGRAEDVLAVVFAAAVGAVVLRVGRARLVCWRRAGVAAVATGLHAVERGSAFGATGRTLRVRIILSFNNTNKCA